MKIDTDSSEMSWILLKFLKDSLNFLVDEKGALQTKRKHWTRGWMRLNLTEESMKQWMPKDDH